MKTENFCKGAFPAPFRIRYSCAQPHCCSDRSCCRLRLPPRSRKRSPPLPSPIACDGQIFSRVSCSHRPAEGCLPKTQHKKTVFPETIHPDSPLLKQSSQKIACLTYSETNSSARQAVHSAENTGFSFFQRQMVHMQF